ncbi:MAG: hypothetical protein PHR87_13000 [Sulfurospirillaceae bacterium]|nr:hypothetical protein [Sulfurospirillaceae bacterium]
MILAFEFQYISQNGVLENLLKNIVVLFDIKHKITREASIVTLYVEESGDMLGKFADYLALHLPLSIFFKSSSVNVVETMPTGPEVIPFCPFSIEFLPRILDALADKKSSMYAYPFSTKDDHTYLLLKHEEKTLIEAHSSTEFIKLYETVAELIAKNESIRIKTQSGSYIFGAIENPLVKEFKENFEVIATDMSVIERMVVIRENELKVLASLERPSIRLKVNAFYAEKGILPTERVHLRLADDLLIHLLCEQLFKRGVHFLFKTVSDDIPYTYSIDYNRTLPFMEPLDVSVLENGEILILKGTSYASPTLKESLGKFKEPAHASFASIMQEHKLFDTHVSCFYLSRSHDDKFMHYSKEQGMVNLVNFYLPDSFEALFDLVTQSSKSGARLVENYKITYPEIYESVIKTVIPKNLPQNIYSLWKMVSMILGFSTEFDSAAEKLIENAENFGGQKGPRLDYYLINEEALISDFNVMKLIRSGMSFKLAGTDDTTLSFGYMESLAYFLSDMTDYYRENISNEKIALGGSLFGYRRFSEAVCKNIKPNSPICFNKELPIDQ